MLSNVENPYVFIMRGSINVISLQQLNFLGEKIFSFNIAAKFFEFISVPTSGYILRKIYA
jgi:hypothetical protein